MQSQDRTQIAGPMNGTRLTEAYARAAARDVYFWAWTAVNVYNRRVGFEKLPGPGRLGGALPAAPPNQLVMLTDYVLPSEREVACPNQDVVYGGGPLALDVEPVVIQVPDFKGRFWVYQVVDTRTDSFVELGKMYDTKPHRTGCLLWLESGHPLTPASRARKRQRAHCWRAAAQLRRRARRAHRRACPWPVPRRASPHARAPACRPGVA